MDDRTRNTLLAVSANFYTAVADSFDDTRQGGWDLWENVLDLAGAPGSVLDVGCGNGRFAAFLDEQLDSPVHYVGIDSEGALIAKAQARYADKQFAVGTVDDAVTLDEQFDLVVCFGVFHHLPGRDYRQTVLQRLTQRVAPGGTLAVSFWQPRLLNNFEQKVCAVTDVDGLQDDELEPDDLLLSWQGSCVAPRYCHHFGDDEIAQLSTASPLPVQANLQGTGNDRTNRYVVFR